MPSDLREPDFVESPSTLSRHQRLIDFVSREASQYGEALGLVVWDARAGKWCAWFDKKPDKPLPTHLDRPAFPPPLTQADVHIGPRPTV